MDLCHCRHIFVRSRHTHRHMQPLLSSPVTPHNKQKQVFIKSQSRSQAAVCAAYGGLMLDEFNHFIEADSAPVCRRVSHTTHTRTLQKNDKPLYQKYHKRKHNQSTHVSVLTAPSVQQFSGYLCFIFVRFSGLLLPVQNTAKPSGKHKERLTYELVQMSLRL